MSRLLKLLLFWCRNKPLPPPPPPPSTSIPQPLLLLLLTLLLSLPLLLLVPSLKNKIKQIRGQFNLQLLSNLPPTTDTSRKITSLHTYPLKACQGLNPESINLTPHGLKNDRVLMIVRSASDPTQPKRFFTQRQCGRVPPSPSPKQPPLTNVVLWDDNLNVIDMGDSAAAFVTNIVNHYEAPTRSSLPPKISFHGSLRLVAFSAEANCRHPNPLYFPSSALTLSGTPPQSALSDGFPILITTTASLRDLNKRIAKKNGATPPPTNPQPISMERMFKDKISKQNPPPPPVMTMDRFRPNIVIENDIPWEEDSWRVIRINGQIFHVVKGCPRCKQSCTDQKTGEVTAEPVETLKTFRCMSDLHPDDVYFGQNVSTTGAGIVSVGDVVEVLVRDERGEGVWDKGTIDAGV
ncbi:hypothetical protein TL16_g06437 [Triparma laevis f. inornata]|uniref:MOSC domain-containing protein n=1 Tax=Triparma laevis f. inornata TaxID=1714386 RepID=A0A9W7APK7_9STRA|nr:hypothetical protein TL16_g06437 [Triparma laevis f. inornata]